MSLAVITLGESGARVADAMRARYGEAIELRSRRDGALGQIFATCFASYRRIVCVMATGIAVRMIAPLATSKLTDPAVVVVDDACRWAISLLSGHEGGANSLAYDVAAATGAEPVITTGSETARRITVGVGCRRGIQPESVQNAVLTVLDEAGLSAKDVRCAATATLKADERGLIDGFASIDIPLLFIAAHRINAYNGPYDANPVAQRRVSLRAVAEPCALIAGRNARLLVRKRIIDGVTVAVAEEQA